MGNLLMKRNGSDYKDSDRRDIVLDEFKIHKKGTKIENKEDALFMRSLTTSRDDSGQSSSSSDVFVDSSRDEEDEKEEERGLRGQSSILMSAPIISLTVLYLNMLEKQFNSVLRRLFDNPPYITYQSVGLNVLLMAMLIISAINGILGTRTTKVIGIYSFIIFQTMVPLYFVIISWPIVWAIRKCGGLRPVDNIKRNWRVYLLLAGIDSISSLLSIFPVLYLSGHLYLMLSQFILPINMLLSRVLSTSRYSEAHFMGAILILFGCIIALMSPVVVTDDRNLSRFVIEIGNIDSDVIVWSFITIVTLLPKALSNIYKEKYTNRDKFNAIHFNTWIATFQLPISWIMTLLIMIPFPPPMFYVPAEKFLDYFSDSFKVLFNIDLMNNNNDSYNITINANDTYLVGREILNPFDSMANLNNTGPLEKINTPMTDSISIFGLFMIYVIVNVPYNNLYLQVIKKFNSNIAVIWSILAIFLMEIGYNWEWLAGPAYDPLKIYDIFVLVIVIIGSMTYKLSKPIQGKAFKCKQLLFC